MAVRMNGKRKGTRNEHRTIQLLERAGYSCTRAAASLGAWDVIGVGSKDVVLVQVKTRDWPGSVEMETLKNFLAPALCRKLVHRWRDRQRLPDVREIS
jgi:Holliday junction resolvase